MRSLPTKPHVTTKMGYRYTDAEKIEMHGTLLRLCNQPQLRPTSGDLYYIGQLLYELRSLEDTEEGRFTNQDLVAVLTYMADQNRRGKSGWAMRPSSILRKPDVIRDLTIECRNAAKRAKKPRPAPTTAVTSAHPQGGTTSRILDEPATPAPEHISKAMAEQMRQFREARKFTR